VDVFTTFLQIAGATSPENQPLDGESLVALLKDPSASLQRDAIFQHFPGYLGEGKELWRTTPVGVIQSGEWKLMEYFEDRHLELYNLREDLSERRNLAQQMPTKAQELHARLVAWREQIRAPMPGPNPTQVRADTERGGLPKEAPKGAVRAQSAPR
jgi:arylsulfatase A-like enzyme